MGPIPDWDAPPEYCALMRAGQPTAALHVLCRPAPHVGGVLLRWAPLVRALLAQVIAIYMSPSKLESPASCFFGVKLQLAAPCLG
jgi:hypothetical protein